VAGDPVGHIGIVERSVDGESRRLHEHHDAITCFGERARNGHQPRDRDDDSRDRADVDRRWCHHHTAIHDAGCVSGHDRRSRDDRGACTCDHDRAAGDRRAASDHRAAGHDLDDEAAGHDDHIDIDHDDIDHDDVDHHHDTLTIPPTTVLPGDG
jgi:hypothetical protein